MDSLHGLGVLITRPAHQSGHLRRLLALEGARTWQLPALEIAEHPARHQLLQDCGPLPIW
jgi:uroporphyrinogen-III synthase